MKNKGITLIALIITIAVLIILATVSIKGLLNPKGIMGEAQKTKDFAEGVVTKTEDELEKIQGKYNEATTGISGWDSNKVTVMDNLGETPVPIPKGFYYIGGNLDSGVVISSKQGDTLTSSGTSSGNQFVWIPVTSEEDLTRTEFDSNGKPISGLLNVGFIEPSTSGYASEVLEYDKMKEQVLKYGGFYIGRYEAGVNSTTLRTAVTSAQAVVCKKGVAPYNYVPWGTSMSNGGASASPSGAVYLAKSMYSSSSSVTSTLCYGSQWDAVCRYIGDAARNTPVKTAPELTGTPSTDVSKNIYDLAGNCYEWTMEAFGPGYRVKRGGCYNTPSGVRGRATVGGVSEGYIYASFRVTLYIK